MASPDQSSVVLALASSDFDQRRSALEELVARAAPLDASLALAVAGCLAGPRKDVQRRAVDVLRAGGAVAHAVVRDALRAACTAADPTHRWGAVYALGHLDCFESVMIPPLLEVLGSPDGDQRWAAAQLLVANADAHGEEIVPALLEALGRPEPLRRKMILYVLRDLGLASTAAIGAFTESMSDPDVGVRLAALSGLVRIEPVPAGVAALVLAMAANDDDSGARRAAVSALGSVGLAAADADSVLDAAAASDDAGLRRAAAVARKRLAGG